MVIPEILRKDKKIPGSGFCELKEAVRYTQFAEIAARSGTDADFFGHCATLVQQDHVWHIIPNRDTEHQVYLDGEHFSTAQKLFCGSVFRIESSAWLVMDKPPSGEKVIVRPNAASEFCVAAYRAYRTARRTADILGISDRTLRRRVANSEEGRRLLRERRGGPRGSRLIP